MPGGPPGERYERLKAVLTRVDDEASSYHIPALLAGLAIGGAAIPSGAVMMTRDGSDQATTIGGAVILGTGIGSVLGGVIQLFVPIGATMDLGEEMADAEATGAPRDVVVLTVEQKWAETMADARLARKVGGAIGIGIGSIAVGAGTAVALADPDSLTDAEKAIVSAGLIFGGALTLVGGLQIFFVQTPQEVAWSTYAASNGLDEEPLITAPRLGLAPTPGGAAVSFDARF
jgi:hypothetical protein